MHSPLASGAFGRAAGGARAWFAAAGEGSMRGAAAAVARLVSGAAGARPSADELELVQRRQINAEIKRRSFRDPRVPMTAAVESSARHRGPARPSASAPRSTAGSGWALYRIPHGATMRVPARARSPATTSPQGTAVASRTRTRRGTWDRDSASCGTRRTRAHGRNPARRTSRRSSASASCTRCTCQRSARRARTPSSRRAAPRTPTDYSPRGSRPM